MKVPWQIADIENLVLVENRSDPCVYFLVRGDRVVYVGQTIRLTDRLRGHAAKDFDRAYFVRCPKEQLNGLERFWISEIKPELNVAGVHNRSPIDHLHPRERAVLMFAARDELTAKMGIGKNAPKPDQVLARMEEMYVESLKQPEAGVTSAADLEAQG